MARLTFTAEARDDLASILRHVTRSAGSQAAGLRFVVRLRKRCAKLATLPGTMGRPRDELAPGLRSAVLGDHVIFFRYTGKEFEVVNILEGHRDLEAHFRTEQ